MIFLNKSDQLTPTGSNISINLAANAKLRQLLKNESLRLLDSTSDQSELFSSNPDYDKLTFNSTAVAADNPFNKINAGDHMGVLFEVGNPTTAATEPIMNRSSVLFVSLSFIVLMVISLAWLVFYYVQRFRYLHSKECASRQWAELAKKAVARIPIKTLHPGDRETNPELDQCAICIEPFQPLENLRILPCRHYFHKICIDPWLLDQHSCPMCKLDIIHAYGFRSDFFMGYSSADRMLTRLSTTTAPIIGSVSGSGSDDSTLERVALIHSHSRSTVSATNIPVTNINNVGSTPFPMVVLSTNNEMSVSNVSLNPAIPLRHAQSECTFNSVSPQTGVVSLSTPTIPYSGTSVIAFPTALPHPISNSPLTLDPEVYCITTAHWQLPVFATSSISTGFNASKVITNSSCPTLSTISAPPISSVPGNDNGSNNISQPLIPVYGWPCDHSVTATTQVISGPVCSTTVIEQTCRTNDNADNSPNGMESLNLNGTRLPMVTSLHPVSKNVLSNSDLRYELYETISEKQSLNLEPSESCIDGDRQHRQHHRYREHSDIPISHANRLRHRWWSMRRTHIPFPSWLTGRGWFKSTLPRSMPSVASHIPVPVSVLSNEPAVVVVADATNVNPTLMLQLANPPDSSSRAAAAATEHVVVAVVENVPTHNTALSAASTPLPQLSLSTTLTFESVEPNNVVSANTVVNNSGYTTD